MNVLEFFMVYWDWYLLIGLFFFVACLIEMPRENYTLLDFAIVLILTFTLWPVCITNLLIARCGAK